MTRRFPVVGAIALLGMGAACGGPSAPTPAQRPNFVIIIADDMAYGLFGADRRLSFLSLPNLEALAGRGVQFERAFVTTSLCSPSRATLLSGLYAHRHGVLGNETTDLPASIDTYPKILQSSGYETAFIGKWHMNSYSDMPRPGFDHWVSFRGQGTYYDPVLNVNGRASRQTGYVTDLITDHATAWLSQRAGRPFLLILSHKAVHPPSEPAPRHQDALSDSAFPEPPSFADTFRDKPSWQRRYAMCGGTPAAFEGCPEPVPASLPPWPWSARGGWRLGYVRTLLSLDESVGSVLSTLANMGVAGSTYVVFLSDNGLFLGEHRLGDKRLAYEESMRIPFVVAGGDLVPRRVSATALNLDLAPTILDLAGLGVPAQMQGRSLVPLLRGQPSPAREAFLYEYTTESPLPVIPDILALRTPARKYVTYPENPGEEELYDLTTDSAEMTNLASRPEWETTRAALRAQLDRLVVETGASR